VNKVYLSPLINADPVLKRCMMPASEALRNSGNGKGGGGRESGHTGKPNEHHIGGASYGCLLERV